MCRASLDGSRREALGEALLTEGKKLEGKGREERAMACPFVLGPVPDPVPFLLLGRLAPGAPAGDNHVRRPRRPVRAEHAERIVSIGGVVVNPRVLPDGRGLRGCPHADEGAPEIVVLAAPVLEKADEVLEPSAVPG